jgi:disulfide bond formation protein DsbB
MDIETGTLFLALLALASEVAVVALGAATLAGRRDLLRQAVGPQALAIGAVVESVATAGSLWLSEGAGFPPCRLCWYQRIAMYPLAVILTIAAIRRDVAIRPYVLAICAIGAAISSYHVLVERFPSLETGACEVANPCSIIWVERFGYLTIPTMALSGFLLIGALVLLATPKGDAA